MGTEGHDALLSWMLERFEPPQAVILWLHPETLAMSTERIERLGYHSWLRQRLRPEYDPLAGIPVLVSANDAVGGLLRTLVLGQGGWDRERLGEWLRPLDVNERLLENVGWFPTKSGVTPDYNHDYPLNPDFVPGIAAFAERCELNGIPLYLFVMPMVQGSPVTETEYHDMVAAIHDGAAEVPLLAPRSIWVDWDEMQSKTHFAAPEARRTSAYLGSLLAEASTHSAQP